MMVGGMDGDGVRSRHAPEVLLMLGDRWSQSAGLGRVGRWWEGSGHLQWGLLSSGR